MTFLVEDMDTLPGRRQARPDLGVAVDVLDRRDVVLLARVARLRHQRGLRLAAAGRHQDAWEAADGVVRAFRRLATLKASRYRPELALALTFTGQCSARLGDREQAVAELAEAVTRYRESLEQLGPMRAQTRARLRAGLATALSDLEWA